MPGSLPSTWHSDVTDLQRQRGAKQGKRQDRGNVSHRGDPSRPIPKPQVTGSGLEMPFSNPDVGWNVLDVFPGGGRCVVHAGWAETSGRSEGGAGPILVCIDVLCKYKIPRGVGNRDGDPVHVEAPIGLEAGSTKLRHGSTLFCVHRRCGIIAFMKGWNVDKGGRRG